jgi:hypothetical protein
LGHFLAIFDARHRDNKPWWLKIKFDDSTAKTVDYFKLQCVSSFNKEGINMVICLRELFITTRSGTVQRALPWSFVYRAYHAKIQKNGPK